MSLARFCCVRALSLAPFFNAACQNVCSMSTSSSSDGYPPKIHTNVATGTSGHDRKGTGQPSVEAAPTPETPKPRAGQPASPPPQLAEPGTRPTPPSTPHVEPAYNTATMVSNGLLFDASTAAKVPTTVAAAAPEGGEGAAERAREFGAVEADQTFLQPEPVPSTREDTMVSSGLLFDTSTAAKVPTTVAAKGGGVAANQASKSEAAVASHTFREPAPLSSIPEDIRPHFRVVLRKRQAPLPISAIWNAVRAGDKRGPAAIKNNFQTSIDCSISLFINPRKSDQLVRGTVFLPHGTGRTIRVAVFATGAAAEAAISAGATVVGGDDLLKTIMEKKGIDADVVVATPEMVPRLSKVARILGPRGLMPNPKFGTVTADVTAAIRRLQKGQLQFRNDKGGVISANIGRAAFTDEQLADNFYAFFSEVMRLRPKGVSGTDVQGYVERVTISTTQGKGFPVQHGELAAAVRARHVSTAAL